MLQFHEEMVSEYTLVSPTMYHNLFFASNIYNLHALWTFLYSQISRKNTQFTLITNIPRWAY